MRHSTRTSTIDLRHGRATWNRSLSYFITCALLFGLSMISFSGPGNKVEAQAGPTMLDTNLTVRVVTGGLITPTSIAFPGPGEIFVLEKNTGKVQYIVNGVLQSTVLDLAVNNASERGLLGIALDPK